MLRVHYYSIKVGGKEGRFFLKFFIKNKSQQGFPGGSVVKNPPDNAGGAGSIPSPGRSRAAKPVHHNYRVCSRAYALKQEKPS